MIFSDIYDHSVLHTQRKSAPFTAFIFDLRQVAAITGVCSEGEGQ